jgi:hypothetical protein
VAYCGSNGQRVKDMRAIALAIIISAVIISRAITGEPSTDGEDVFNSILLGAFLLFLAIGW